MTSPTLIQQYDAIWRGQAHRNLCVSLKDGKTTLKVDGMPDYQLYYVQTSTQPPRPSAIFAQGLETDGKIDIDTPEAPHINTAVCLGIAVDPSAER